MRRTLASTGRQTIRRAEDGTHDQSANGNTTNGKSAKTKIRRLNLKLPETVVKELDGLSKESGRTMTEIVRLALALIAIAVDEEKAGHKLAVIEGNGKVLKELVLAK